jgi:hypothetical protein
MNAAAAAAAAQNHEDDGNGSGSDDANDDDDDESFWAWFGRNLLGGAWLQRHGRSPAAARVPGVDWTTAPTSARSAAAPRGACAGSCRGGTFRNAVLGAGGTVVGLDRLNRDGRTLPSASRQVPLLALVGNCGLGCIYRNFREVWVDVVPRGGSGGSTRRRTGGAHDDDATAAELARVETPASDAMRGGGHMVSPSAYVARWLVDLARSVLQLRDYYCTRRRGRYADAYQLFRNAIHTRDRRTHTTRHRALSFDYVADEQMASSLLREERVDEVPHVSENQQAGATVPVGEEVVHRGILRPGCLRAVIEQEGVQDLRATRAEPRIVAGGTSSSSTAASANLVDRTCRSERSDHPARHGDNRPLTRAPSRNLSSRSRNFRKRR